MQALAGDGGFEDLALPLPLDHMAIHRDPLSGPDLESGSNGHLIRSDVPGLAAPTAAGRRQMHDIRGELDQGLDCPPGAPQAPGFQGQRNGEQESPLAAFSQSPMLMAPNMAMVMSRFMSGRRRRTENQALGRMNHVVAKVAGA